MSQSLPTAKLINDESDDQSDNLYLMCDLRTYIKVNVHVCPSHYFVFFKQKIIFANLFP